ncbi:MAG: HIT domain-containing protein [Candidatus Omnitrophica bacterium]|nr:HIT domain-containing protein [Candidatus Omnitrophota bacterium]
MDKLWAPWRINYVQGKKKKGCIFCAAAKAGIKDSHLVFKSAHSICLLNIFPYNNGHLMVAPKKHVNDLDKLNSDELLALVQDLLEAKKLLSKVLKPEGFNIGINSGTIAGSGIPGHLHIHIVPRWTGDTNFMPVVGGTKVISQSLEELRKRLRNAYAKTN